MRQTAVEKGLILVFTGDGKGKTTAALGTGLRATGYGHRVVMIQFIKGTWRSGELDALERLGLFEVHRSGAGFYRIGNDQLPEEMHRQAAREGLALAREKMQSGRYRVVILDEINNALQTGLLPLAQVLALIEQKPPAVDLILTGRDAPPELLDLADLVTEMKEIKHPFRQGIMARKGIDY